MGVDVMTMGNHTWAKRDIFNFIGNKNIVRPANYSENLPGNGYTIIEKDNKISELESQVVDPIDLEELKSIVQELKTILSK